MALNLALQIHQSLRGLARSPGFAVSYIATVALSFAALLTTTSVWNGVVQRPVAAAAPERLVAVSAIDIERQQPGYVYVETLAAYRQVQTTLVAVSIYSARYFRVEVGPNAGDAMTEAVDANYFDLLGSKIVHGRAFNSGDSATLPVVVISKQFHRRLLSGVADPVGTTITIDRKPVTVIGVAAPGVQGLQFDGGADLFMPFETMQVLSGARLARARSFIGRLAPRADLMDVQAELDAKWPSVQETTLPAGLTPADRLAAKVQRLRAESVAGGFSTMRMRYGQPLGSLAALSGLLAAIAALNLSTLLLARSLRDRQQHAIRLSLGASRRTILWRTVLEAIVLSLAGLLIAVPVSMLVTRAVANTFAFGRTTPLVQNLSPNPTLLVVAAGLTIMFAMITALVPAWTSARVDIHGELASRTVARGFGRAGKAILITQVAASVSVLVVAALFATSLAELRSNFAAIRIENVMFTRLSRIPGDRSALPAGYWRDVLSELANAHSVRAAAISVYFPTYFQYTGALPTDRYASSEPVPAAETAAFTDFVSPGFFDTYGIDLLSGRDFTWADDQTSPPVAVISRSAARALGGERQADAVGTFITVAAQSGSETVQVIGVVADAAFAKVRDRDQPTILRPIAQRPSIGDAPLLHVRADSSTAQVRQALDQAVTARGKHYVPVLFVFGEFLNAALLKERMAATLSGVVGLIIVLLACVGVYGMLAYMVSSRTREIGVRSALGATNTTILWMMTWEALTIAIPGIVIGLGAAIGAARLIQTQLYHVGADTMAPFVAGAAILGIAVLAASIMPAWSASRISPMRALMRE